jgi:hypothetical protein
VDNQSSKFKNVNMTTPNIFEEPGLEQPINYMMSSQEDGPEDEPTEDEDEDMDDEDEDEDEDGDDDDAEGEIEEGDVADIADEEE